jgi:hypothetical protein
LTELTEGRVGATAWLEVKDKGVTKELNEPVALSNGKLGRGPTIPDADAQGGWLIPVTIEADASSFGRERYQVVGTGRHGRERRVIAERYRLTFEEPGS